MYGTRMFITMFTKDNPQKYERPIYTRFPLVSSYEHFQAELACILVSPYLLHVIAHPWFNYTNNIRCYGTNCQKHTTKYFYWNSVQEYTSVVSWFVRFDTVIHSMSQTLQLCECFSLLNSTNSGKMYFSVMLIYCRHKFTVDRSN